MIYIYHFDSDRWTLISLNRRYTLLDKLILKDIFFSDQILCDTFQMDFLHRCKNGLEKFYG